MFIKAEITRPDNWEEVQESTVSIEGEIVEGEMAEVEVTGEFVEEGEAVVEIEGEFVETLLDTTVTR